MWLTWTDCCICGHAAARVTKLPVVTRSDRAARGLSQVLLPKSTAVFGACGTLVMSSQSRPNSLSLDLLSLHSRVVVLCSRPSSRCGCEVLALELEAKHQVLALSVSAALGPIGPGEVRESQMRMLAVLSREERRAVQAEVAKSVVFARNSESKSDSA